MATTKLAEVLECQRHCRHIVVLAIRQEVMVLKKFRVCTALERMSSDALHRLFSLHGRVVGHHIEGASDAFQKWRVEHRCNRAR
jgi:hypothetical protein